jgi:hypothetical protein
VCGVDGRDVVGDVDAESGDEVDRLSRLRWRDVGELVRDGEGDSFIIRGRGTARGGFPHARCRRDKMNKNVGYFWGVSYSEFLTEGAPSELYVGRGRWKTIRRDKGRRAGAKAPCCALPTAP